MSPRAVPCDSCGSPIADADLETGAAVTLLGKRYCAGCKTEAIQSVSLEDLSGAPAAPARKPAAPAKAAAPRPAPAKAAAPPPPAPARPERKAPARRPVPAAPAASRTPLIAAGAGVVVLLLAGGAFVAFRGSPEAPPPVAPVKAGGPTQPTPPSADPEAQAKAAYIKVKELADRGGVSWDVLLSAGGQARGACKGTSFEKPLDAILARAQKEKDAEDSSRELAPLIDELKGAVAGDPEFKRYSELQPKFQLAIETGAKSASPRVAEIRALQNDYNSRYEKVAEPIYTEIFETATALADERRYDDAVRKIDTFPQQFRNSNAWKNLLKLRQDIERKKKK